MVDSTVFQTRAEVEAQAFAAGTAPAYLKTHEYAAGSRWGGAKYVLATDQNAVENGDVVTASGNRYRLHQAVVHPQMFGNYSGTDNSGILQQWLDHIGDADNQASGLLPATTFNLDGSTGLRIRDHFGNYEGLGPKSRLVWNSPTGTLLEIHSDTTDSPILQSLFNNFSLEQGVAPSIDGTGAKAIVSRRLASAIFTNFRTSNFATHHESYGMTRARFIGCSAYGNTLWDTGLSTAGSSFLVLNTHINADMTRRPAANIEIGGGTEFAGNHADVRNMSTCIRVTDCDGLFIDRSTYIGLARATNIQFTPSHPESVFTNITLDNFNDGGQATAGTCVEFTEQSAGYMTGICNAIRISGVLSGAAGYGIRLNIENLTQLNVHATMRTSAAGGAAHIGLLRGSGLNITGCDFIGTVQQGDIHNPTGTAIVGLNTTTST